MSGEGQNAMPETKNNRERSRDSVANTLTVSIVLSLVASVLVATAAISLKPIQERNEEQFRQKIILDVAGLYSPGADISELFSGIDTRMVDLASGEYTDAAEAGEFDAIAAAKDPLTGINIPPADDIANIKQRARVAPVYLVLDGTEVTQVILPIYGSGLWSTMFGFLSLDPDGTTIRGLRFYEHAETPGLGDQIDNSDWRAQWVGKKVFADDDQPRVEVIRGFVDQNSVDAVYQVDGLSGATLTGRGVTKLVQYWTGPHGFGPYLAKLRSEESADD
jgi:Na+-transporting NADH:ubiquinone oxidoreductase subunit C